LLKLKTNLYSAIKSEDSEALKDSQAHLWHTIYSTEGTGKRIRIIVNTKALRYRKGSHSFTCTPCIHPLTE